MYKCLLFLFGEVHPLAGLDGYFFLLQLSVPVSLIESVGEELLFVLVEVYHGLGLSVAGSNKLWLNIFQIGGLCSC